MAGLNQFTNNASTTLASGINSSVTSLTVASSTGGLFPTLAGSQYFYCTLSNTAGTVLEIVKVTARSTDTFTIVRAQDNTTASAFSAGDKVELRLTAIDLQNFPQLDSTNTFSQTQTFVTPILGTPTSGTLTNCTGYTTANLSGSIGLTTQVTGTLPIANGGTNSTATATAGGVGYGTGTAHAYTAAGTAGQVLTSNGSSAPSWAAAASFDVGTRLAFQQTSAPTGWTKDTTAAINDSMLRLVTGSASSGGSTAFSTWSAATTTGGFTLTTNEIPSHSHGGVITTSTTTGSSGASYASAGKTTVFLAGSTSTTGSGASHSHSITASLKYYDFIIASKN